MTLRFGRCETRESIIKHNLSNKDNPKNKLCGQNILLKIATKSQKDIKIGSHLEWTNSILEPYLHIGNQRIYEYDNQFWH